MPGMSADAVTVRPATAVAGTISVPGDKSVSHRYAMLAALADGVSTIEHYSPGADCAATLACLRALGARIRHRAPDVVEVEGRGLRGLQAPAGTLDAANSGTTMRLMAGVLAAHSFRCVLTGDSSLVKRPMRRVIEPLTRMGATIDASDGRPPLVIHGGTLHGISFAPDIPSAQVKSAVLLAGLQGTGRTAILEPAQTRDHTERALDAFGVELKRDGSAITIDGGQSLRARPLQVPGDISSATFWIALAAATPGADIEIHDVGLNPTRTAVLDVIRRVGASIETIAGGTRDGEPVGRIRVRAAARRGFSLQPEEVPAVIDEIPALAAVAALLPAGETMEVDGAGELRVKESDRIAGLARGFRAMGAEVEEFPDGFRLTARPLMGATVDALGDHRLAMAFAIAATGARGPTTITGASSVAVSYPAFFDELDRLAVSGDRR
jgi:3-phosphoshikimate 1-carboxyvinyltransferase